MNKFVFTVFVQLCLLASLLTSAQERQEISFNKEWRFFLGDNPQAKDNSFNDTSWKTLNLPHDWSIEGQFSDKHPATAGGGALPGGTGWYRKTFSLPTTAKNKQVEIRFDGIYRLSEVWINGHYLGKRPFGYIGIQYDLTPFLNIGGQNTLAVRVDNSKQPNSRWYSGSGIYRNVWLTITNPVAIDPQESVITTPLITQTAAQVHVNTVINNKTKGNQEVAIRTVVYDATGKIVAQTSATTAIAAQQASTIQQDIQVSNPILWSDSNPYLYKTVRTISLHGKIIDSYSSNLGIRYFNFDRAKGFSLNGKSMKIRGVCNHHDLGCLGSAFNVRAAERQLEILKAMGCNGIRTSHNPPAPELLDLCDKMGFLVMDEAFDMWKEKKSDFDYSMYFEEWHKRDLEAFVKRDRNHPSVILWSIGNEIWEQQKEESVPIANELISIVKSLDTTRKITMAIPEFSPNYPIMRANLDIIGFNYGIKKLDSILTKYPNKPFILSETTSALETRGHYDMPADSLRAWPIRYDVPFTEGNADLTCSAYDNVRAPWGATHEENWQKVKQHDYLSGMFVWTGFDYLGEPTPYWYPARSSYFGIIDLAGFPKDVYYMYQSEWTQKPVLHLLPHWNWKAGQSIDVWAYSNAEEVELFLNGKSVGTKKKAANKSHFAWKVPFEAGTLTAVSKSNGKVILTESIKTAGKPSKLVLSTDRSQLKADGKDLSFVTVKVLDEAGNIVPTANNMVTFELTGTGSIAGLDNGSPTCLEPMKGTSHSTFNGLGLAVIQTTQKQGSIQLKASSAGLKGAVITLIAK